MFSPRKRKTRSASELYASFGYTTAQEGRGTPSAISTMSTAAKQGGLKIDVVVYSDIIGAAETIKARLYSRNYANHFRIGGALGSSENYGRYRLRLRGALVDAA